jgi:AcrR family transcriptional regulator
MTDDPKAIRRREILEAAIQAFTEKGYDKTSVDDIARAADVSKGTLYWYFENKQMLFAALVQLVFDDFEAAFGQVIAATSTQSPPERLRAFIIEPFACFGLDLHHIGLYIDFFVQAWQYEIVQQTLKNTYTRYLDTATVIIQDGIDQGVFRPVDATHAACAIAGAVDGVMFQMLVSDTLDIHTTIQALADIVLQGLKP